MQDRISIEKKELMKGTQVGVGPFSLLYPEPALSAQVSLVAREIRLLFFKSARKTAIPERQAYGEAWLFGGVCCPSPKKWWGGNEEREKRKDGKSKKEKREKE